MEGGSESQIGFLGLADWHAAADPDISIAARITENTKQFMDIISRMGGYSRALGRYEIATGAELCVGISRRLLGHLLNRRGTESVDRAGLSLDLPTPL